MNKVYIVGLFVVVGLSCTVHATSIRNVSVLTDPQSQLDRYKSVSTVQVSDIVIPQVVTVGLMEGNNGTPVLVNEQDEQVPMRLHNTVNLEDRLDVGRSSFSSIANISEDPAQVHYFDSREDVHQFRISALGGPINSLDLYFVENMLPVNTVSVEYEEQGQWIPLVTDTSRVTNIPLGSIPGNKNVATILRVTIKSDHLVGLADTAVFSDVKINEVPTLAWYAEPNTTYTLYQAPSFGQKTNFHAATDQPLRIDEKTIKARVVNTGVNPFYNPDYDGDGINDEADLCPRNSDTSNADADGNGRGDVCEDKDQDGRVAGEDNCPLDYNPNQKDIDADGVGDVCDDTDSRVSEQLPYLQIMLFGLFAGLLLWLTYRSVRK